MTEAEWLARVDPRPMLKFLRRRASDRKVRLFACACPRRNWDWLTAAARRVVEAAEGFADGAVTAARLARALWKAADDAGTRAATAACWSANPERKVVERSPFEAAKSVAEGLARSSSPLERKAARDAELRVQAALLRCAAGNPFRSVTFPPAWRTRTAAALARQMYDSRDFGAMPILADALQDAGCTDEGVLGHCRGPGPHVRGCWVVDLVLGKE